LKLHSSNSRSAHRNAALRYLRAAFNFGIRSRWLKENPIKGLEFAKIVRDLSAVNRREAVAGRSG
jgi:hypothetical protein